jgi:hypothetical protein
MSHSLSRRRFLAGSLALGALACPLAAPARPEALQSVLDYARRQRSTGFLVIQERRTLAEENWPAPLIEPLFRSFRYETTPEGALLEDVASQQKSFVSMLVAIAIDKGLLEVSQAVLSYIGPACSLVTREQEAGIRLLDLLTMSSGLATDLTYLARPGTVFLYNTPAYAVTKHILTAVAGQPLETLTRDWLTGPACMSQTSWRTRPPPSPRQAIPPGWSPARATPRPSARSSWTEG